MELYPTFIVGYLDSIDLRPLAQAQTANGKDVHLTVIPSR